MMQAPKQRGHHGGGVKGGVSASELQRIIRVQNHVIIGLSSLFVLLIITTFALIHMSSTLLSATNTYGSGGSGSSSSTMPVRRHISSLGSANEETAVTGGGGGGFGKSRFGPDSASSDTNRQGGGAGSAGGSSSTGIYQGMQFDDHGRPIGKLLPGGVSSRGAGAAVRGGVGSTTQQQQQQQQQPMSTATVLQVSKCKYQYFGCPIFPSELSALKAGSIYYPSHASSGHIMMTHKSNRLKPQINQDRAVLFPSFVYSMYTRSRNDTIEALIDSRDDFFLGIFDGHGNNGHRVAQYAAEEIPSRLASKMMSSSSMTAGGNKKYDDDKESSISDELIREIYKEVDEVITIKDAGSTASIVVRVGQQLYMANTGDSTSYICIYEPPISYNKEVTRANKLYVTKKRDGLPDRYGREAQQLHLQGTVTIHNQNIQHKPHASAEKSRIENAGGRIVIDNRLKLKKNNNNNWSRVVVPAGGELAMSRSIGDVDFANVGVIPDPDVTVVNLREFWSEHDIVDDDDGSSSSTTHTGKKVFVVLGSDGLFDARKVEYVAQHVAYGLFEWGQGWGQRIDDLTNEDVQRKFSAHLLDVGRKLVDMASPVKASSYRDDITFIAKRIELQN